MHSPFSIMEVNTTWKQDMERVERQLARKLKANTPSDAIIAEVSGTRRQGRAGNPLASLATVVSGTFHALTARFHHAETRPVQHRQA